MQVRVNFKLEKGLKLSKKEKKFYDKLIEDKQAKEVEEKNKVNEPSFEEKQLKLLQSIDEKLSKLSK